MKYFRNGKPYRESTGTDNKMVAKKLLDRRDGDIAQGMVPGIQFDKVTFDELAEEFLTEYKINARKSLDRAELSIKPLREGFGGIMITEITTPRIQDYVSDRIKWACTGCRTKFHFAGILKCPKCGGIELEKGAANGTINRELAAQKRLLSLGARQTPPKANRVPYIPMLKENNTRRGFFEHKDFLALREALPEYLKPMALFGYKVGWRDQEITPMTWNAVDLDYGIRRWAQFWAQSKSKGVIRLDNPLDFMARPKRFERSTDGFVVRYSIQLSYGRKLFSIYKPIRR